MRAPIWKREESKRFFIEAYQRAVLTELDELVEYVTFGWFCPVESATPRNSTGIAQFPSISIPPRDPTANPTLAIVLFNCIS
jgi:hypothetical protein